MGQAVRKFEVVEGGSAMSADLAIADPIADPLRTDENWLNSDDLSHLAGIADRVARRAIKSRKWRGADLNVREVEIGRGGAGGKALQVHVDSLPADLREDWYLARGITLHERADPVSGQTGRCERQPHPCPYSG